MASAYIASTSASIEAAFISAYASAICAEAADPLRFIAERLLESTIDSNGSSAPRKKLPRDSVAVAKARGLGLSTHHEDDDADDGEPVDAFRPGKKRMPRDSVAVAKAHGLGIASHHHDDDADDGDTVDAFRPGKKRMPRDSVAVAKAHGIGHSTHHDDDDDTTGDGEPVDAFRPGKKRMPRDSVAVAKARGMGLHDDANGDADDDDVSTLSLHELVVLEVELEAKLRAVRAARQQLERGGATAWAGEEGEAFRPGGRTKVSRARDSMAVAKARGSGGGGGDRLSVDLEVDGAGGAVLRTEEFAANSCAA